MINSKQDAYDLLNKLNAPEDLKMHIQLVGEAAELLIDKFLEYGVPVDGNFIETGVILHDIGKIIHTNELAGSGSNHLKAGEKILTDKGIDPKIARCCISHENWASMNCSLEELLISLSDKLWKGNRVAELELLVIDSIASIIGKDRWEIFLEFDLFFEGIASDGHKRLQRSMCR